MRISSRRSRPRASCWTNRRRASSLTYDEAVEPRLAIISVTDADGHQETTGPVHRSPANPDTLVVLLRSTSARGVVPDLLARDLRGRPSRRGGVHLRGRAESRTGAAVPGSEHLSHRDHATVVGRALGDVRRGDDGDRAVRDEAADSATAYPGGRGREAARVVDCVRRSLPSLG